MLNPYEPPQSIEEESDGEDDTQESLTLIPADLTRKTRIVVVGFGLFQFFIPWLTAWWTDTAGIDFFAVIIVVNGARIRRTSFRRFPWTTVLCSLYVGGGIASLFFYNPLDWSFWLPRLQWIGWVVVLPSTVWAIIAIAMLYRCHRSHQ